jgi:hypothetical protein
VREALNRWVSSLRARGLALLRGVPQEQHAFTENMLLACQARLRAAESALRNLERAIGTEIGKHVVERIGSDMSRAVRREISKAAMKAIGSGADVFKIEVPTEELRWLDPDAIQSRVLEEWKDQAAPRLRAYVDLDSPIALEECVTILDVRVPELGYRHHIARLD